MIIRTSITPQDKEVLKEWRDFNKSVSIKNISPLLKKQIEKSDNIRLDYYIKSGARECTTTRTLPTSN